MKSIGGVPAYSPISADDLAEFHAARIILLLKHSGAAGRIKGLTKLAKLDFFVRYPDFFRAVQKKMTGERGATASAHEASPTETAMIRHHYGPWDKRYYHVLAYLEARAIISVAKDKNAYVIALTERGLHIAKDLSTKPSYTYLISRMRDVKQVFGGKSGNTIKNLIYDVFEEEVGEKPLGTVIGQ